MKPAGRETSAARSLTLRVLSSLSEIEAAAWNALAGQDNPFVTHEFLIALERHGCVAEENGWVPQHMVLEDHGNAVAAMPAYLKFHSYGEFVFDWSWADALERAGKRYFPKLLCAVPFTPATGPRLLVAEGEYREAYASALVSAALRGAEKAGLSSAHFLFNDAFSCDVLQTLSLMRRDGCQYHWENPGYRDFDDFLDGLSSKRRKQIRKERRESSLAPVEITVIPGSQVSEAQWRAYHRLYASTYDRKWGYPSLTADFFIEIGKTMGDSVLLILAGRDDHYVAGAHLLVGRTTLYGRNWGCSEQHRSLHFEMCYYRGIEYCIENRLGRFEAGAQGEHKLTRGFMPRITHSYHWVAHPGLRAAIEDFLIQEQRDIGHHVEYMASHTPFKQLEIQQPR